MTEEHHHCHCHNHEHHHEEHEIQFNLTENEKQTIEQLLTVIKSTENKEIKEFTELLELIKTNNEMIKYIISNNRMNILLQYISKFIYPTIQFTESIRQMISFMEYLSTTEYKMSIILYNIPALFIQFFHTENIDQEIIFQLLTIYMNIMENDQSILLMMKYQLFPIIMIWTEFGNCKIKLLLLTMLLKIISIPQIVSFICASEEKVQQLLFHLIQLKNLEEENQEIITLINTICLEFSSKNEIFKVHYEKLK